MKTEKEITLLIKKLDSWGMMANLTESERLSIIHDLWRIASFAVLDANSAVENMLVDLSKRIAP